MDSDGKRRGRTVSTSASHRRGSPWRLDLHAGPERLFAVAISICPLIAKPWRLTTVDALLLLLAAAFREAGSTPLTALNSRLLRG